MWTHRHLLGIEELSTEDVTTLLTASERVLARMRAPEATSGGIARTALRGRTIINLFFESSTRTRTSFELAGKRLGADVVNVSPSQSSVTKGETLLDTVRNIEAMHADAIVIRHAASGAPHFVAARTHASIVNAGDGAHEHPTQALLDAVTMRAHGKNLEGARGRDRRRHPPLARRALERASPRQARRERPPLRAEDDGAFASRVDRGDRACNAADRGRRWREPTS